MAMTDRHTNRVAHNRRDLSGETFGNLSVIRPTDKRKNRRILWECLCSCGNTVEVLSKYILNGDTKSCGCISRGNAHNRNAVGKITASMWTPIERQAARRGIPFEITREEAWEKFLSQGERCALSGVDLSFAQNLRDQRDQQTASLDRIDSARGYVSDNIQWVHKIVNIMKNSYSEGEFIRWCGLVLDNMAMKGNNK